MCIFCGGQCGGIGDALYSVIIGLLFKARYWLRARSKITSHFDAPTCRPAGRSITPGCVARRLNSLLFALLAPCHACASTPEN
ncbi:MAG: hypothetical protein JW883_15905, partial [Deltaproteobacteria bacterium]|nr:hypothetical protein [Deltaproteobacteria bacterium]